MTVLHALLVNIVLELVIQSLLAYVMQGSTAEEEHTLP